MFGMLRNTQSTAGAYRSFNVFNDFSREVLTIDGFKSASALDHKGC